MPQFDSDAFTYADGNLATVSSAKWTKMSSLADMVVSTNKVRGTGADSASVITSWSGSTTDHYAQVAVSTISSDAGGPTVRGDAVNNMYLGHLGTSSAIEVYSDVVGTFTRIIASASNCANGDTFYLEIQGTNLVVKKNGVQTDTVSNSALASGKPGVYGFDTTHRLDDWAAGDFSPVGPVITVQPTPQTVIAGSTANFTITATGTGTLHYQWKLNGSNVGTDSSSYTTAATINTDNLSTIQCVVTDDVTSTNSTIVYLLVIPTGIIAWIIA